MTYYIVGLGNPGGEYQNTRHNTGRLILDVFRKTHNLLEGEEDKKNKILVSKNEFGKEKIILMEPNNFMNNSGKSLKTFIKNIKQAEKLIVIYDDLDLAMGQFKISFGRGSGGHRGVESIIKTLKTKNFIRIRVGISPKTILGKMKKPKGEKKVLDFIMRNFSDKEMTLFKKVSKKITQALEVIIVDGREKAMNKFN